MNYNITPFIKEMEKNNPNRDIWIMRLEKFFQNENYDPALQDEWYNYLLENIDVVSRIFKMGYLVDPYTALVSFDDISLEGKNAFNLAYYVVRNYDKFIRKNVLTVVGDYGIINLQLQLCGIKVVSSIMEKEQIIGSILTAIVNECGPYPINHYQFPTHDIIIANSVFDGEEKAWHNWQALLDQYAIKKEIYFTTNTFEYLKKYANYDKIQLLELPIEVYDPKDYEDLRFGYTNNIYKLQ